MNKLNILIPISGNGERFKNTHPDPKPLIYVNQLRMIELVLKNINYEANYIFIVKQEHLNNYNLKEILEKNTTNSIIIPISKTTDGAARSALLAKDYINNDNPLFIINGDQYIEMNFEKYFDETYNDKTIDGSIVCFSISNDPKWSYVELNERGHITKVLEKIPLPSNLATAGLYWWRSGKVFVDSAEKMIEANDRTNGEVYIAPSYNYMNDAKIVPYIIEKSKFHGLGTPNDLDEFLSKNIKV